ncbi:hypothetical protein CRUP_029113, partial [Coryphaenoides rupestris]
SAEEIWQPHCALDCSSEDLLTAAGSKKSPPPPTKRSARRPRPTMDIKLLALTALLAVAINAPISSAKPISLVERCWCRSTRNTVPQRSIKELKFLHTPNCPFQVM